MKTDFAISRLIGFKQVTGGYNMNDKHMTKQWAGTEPGSENKLCHNKRKD